MNSTPSTNLESSTSATVKSICTIHELSEIGALWAAPLGWVPYRSHVGLFVELLFPEIAISNVVVADRGSILVTPFDLYRFLHFSHLSWLGWFASSFVELKGPAACGAMIALLTNSRLCLLFVCNLKSDYGAATVMFWPAAPVTGVIAGGSMRIVLEMARVENALGKQLGSNNALSIARATRGIPTEELWKW
ncbi:hypothetical protein Ancab_005183 [Ancistrocladus abbreviatus]